MKKKYLVSLPLVLLFFALGFLFARATTISQNEANLLSKEVSKKGFKNGYRDSWDQSYLAGEADGASLGKRRGQFTGKIEGSEAGYQAVRQKIAAIERRRARLYGKGAVLVVGDSLEVLTIPYLKKELSDISLTTNAVGGYNSMQIYDLFKKNYRPEHSVIVFDAGTNDNPNYPQILAEQLDKVRDTIGPKRCLVLPTIYGYTVDGANSAGKNRVLRQVKKEHKIVYLPDWHRIATTRADLMMDELHPNPEGTRLRAQMIAKSVRKCLDRGISDNPVGSDEIYGVESDDS